MNTFIKIIFIAATVASCSQQGKKDQQAPSDTVPKSPTTNNAVSVTDYFKVIGDSAEIPSFDITVELSDKAVQELSRKKESIIVTAYYSGTPKDTTKYMEDGGYAVATKSIELVDKKTATFRGIKISKEMYESLADKNIEGLINIYSGRRSSQLNLLDCEILQKPISELKDHQFTLKGKLIGE